MQFAEQIFCKALLKAIWDAGVCAVAPDKALLAHLRIVPSPGFTIGSKVLEAGNFHWQLGSGRIFCLGAGKGVAPLASALEGLLGASLSGGFVVAKKGHALPLERIKIAEASHPLPDQSSIAAGENLLCTSARCKPDDLLICLFTGGASALCAAPAPGLALEDLRHATEYLLRCGAEIQEINAIRKHLSLIGGGRLLQNCRARKILALFISDVIGDDFSVIASGPTAPDPSSFDDCLAIVAKYGLKASFPKAVLAYLELGARGLAAETAKKGEKRFDSVHNLLIASNRDALFQAAREAEKCSLRPMILTDRLRGEARNVACDLVAKAREIASSLKTGDSPVCLLAGGECTVRLTGNGLGGRNQEMALAASLELAGDSRICALFAGTDGTDGPTDAAGGFAFGESVAKMGGRREALAMLEANDSYHALKRSGDLFHSGPTRTNVMDLALILIAPPKGD